MSTLDYASIQNHVYFNLHILQILFMSKQNLQTLDSLRHIYISYSQLKYINPVLFNYNSLCQGLQKQPNLDISLICPLINQI